MTTTLITGANKSLGYETARQLVALGHTVYVAARDISRGQAAADTLGARFVQLDVTDEASVDKAAALVRDEVGSLDVLVNNAGILGSMVSVADARAEDLRHVYETNVFGVVTVTRAFLPLLQASDHPVVVNVTSGLGSMAVVTDPTRVEFTIAALAYPSSKAALNMVTTQYAKSFPGIRVNMVDPGYTGTDFNGHRGPQTVAEGVEAIVAMATIGPDGPTGTFTDRHGVVAW